MVIADKEINAMEVEVLDRQFQLSNNDALLTKRQSIFSDSEDKVLLESLLSDLRLKNITKEEKGEIIRILSKVAYGDDYLAKQERELLEKVGATLNYIIDDIVNEVSKCSEERIEAARLSTAKRIVGKAENFLYDHFADKSNTKTIDMLLGSLGYSASIEKITDDAIVDLNRVTKIVDKINASLTNTNQSLKALIGGKKKHSKEVKQVIDIIDEIAKSFDEIIENSLKENVEVLNKKARNIRYFTIAFMGRTKAGKSTLHKVITQQKNDDIGQGKLRTTRYNRSWYWDKLRIVDTPGIGAPGGEPDTEIARSIIDEADIICYIVTSDSIQETEFDFFDTIKERNKPLYIILNVKSNLSQSVRLKRFLENPNAWRECAGPQSIQGHIDRIHDRLDGKYNMDAVEIIPIHLLSAQYGFSSDYDEETAKKLQDGSNIFSFTRSIKSEVHRSGGLKKSLSVVDGTAYQIHQIGVVLQRDYKKLKDGHDLLLKKKNKFESFIKKEKQNLYSDLKTILSGAQNELHNRASTFASENYDNKNAGEKWGNDASVKAIYSRLNEKINNRIEDFNEKLKSELEEIASDIQIVASLNFKTNVNGTGITNIRLGVGIIGAILTAATAFIAPWAPFVAGIVVSIITSMFTSKADKIQKATEKMRTQLFSNINQGIEEYSDKISNSVRKSIQNTNKSIIELLDAYINGTSAILKEIDELCTECGNSESAINSLVGLRILEFVDIKTAKDSTIHNMDDKDLRENFPVSRDWTRQSLTYNYDVTINNKKIAKAEQATQMKILTK